MSTVLVLTPSMGGHYFGELVAGLTREVAGAGGRLVVVETRSETAPRDEFGVPGDFAAPVAWSLVDAAVSITTAVDDAYLQQLRDLGRPVVLTSTLMDDFDAPAAMPDNHGGTVTAVEHLIGHGHTDIGFVGNLAQQDIRDRHQAYRMALAAHGLAADPAAFFAAHDNGEAAGEHAGRELLAGTARPTALMVATDGNAIGLMRALSEAGMVLPDELAVVAYDNIDVGAFSIPSLSTVNQRFDEVGSLAGRLVLAAIGGLVVPNIVFTSDSAALTTRTSCGCSAGGRRVNAEAGLPPDVAAARLRDELEATLSATTLSGDAELDTAGREAVATTVRAAERLLTSGERVTARRIRALTVSLQRLTARTVALRRAIAAMIDYTDRVADLGEFVSPAAASRVVAELWKAQAGAFLQRADAAELAIVEQYAVDAGLLTTIATDPRELRWLAGTHVQAGVLALWGPDDPDSADRDLEIVGAYDPNGAVPGLIGVRTAAESFPPESLIAAVSAADREVCVVVPVRTAARDWGLLAVVGSIDTISARETYRHWAELLCSALESQRLQAEIARSALHDPLTGLPNRRLFLERLDAAVARQHRSGTPFAMLFLDLDGFKQINDSRGHQVGDGVLTAVGERIIGVLRSVDTGARIGGDEFAVLLHDTDPTGALLVAGRVQAALAEPLDLDGADVSIRASVGIATSSVDFRSSEDILHEADTAMYRAKNAEPGTIAFFDEAMRGHAVDQQRFRTEIHRALAERQFEVHYQPIVDVASGRADSVEALVHWRHPERGLVPPDAFLPVMDEAGSIVQLGYWVVDEVCRQLVEWGPQVASVHVNVSELEFWHRGLMSHVLEILRRHGLASDRLVLEVSEGTLMRHAEVASRMVQGMRDAGLRLHLDGFGAGVSSL